MILETVDISDISQDLANVRKHSDRNLEAIAASLRAFGQQKPIVVDKRGVILAGNGTYEAAKRIGWDKIKITRTDLSGTLATAYAIADNRTAELAEWDDTALAEQLRSLQSEEFDLANVGYTDDEVQQLIDGIGNGILGASEVTEDEIPEPPADPITKPGDLWLLGEHRLLCGDSTNPDDVNRLMNGEKADLCLTDPPYGVSYADKNSFLNAIDKGNKNQTQIENDHLSKSDSQKLWKDSFQQMFNSMKPGACIYCFMPQGGDQMMMMMMMMMESGIEPKHELIWLKNNHVLGRTDYAYKHEPILYAWKKGGHKFYGEFQTSVLEFPRPQKSDLHPTMKPVNLISKLISNSSMDNHVVFDPFLGSGTTLIAAEQLGRKCYGMEISPQYCDVIVKRWETLTGRVATRA